MSTAEAVIAPAEAVQPTLFSSPKLWGPPFTNSLTYPWGFLPGQTPAGFWTSVRPDPWNGAIVAQMGSKPHPATQPPTEGALLTEYRIDKKLPAGLQAFLLRLDVGPVSLNRKYGSTAEAYVLLQLTGPSFNWADFRPAVGNSIMYLDVTPPSALREGIFRLRFGIYLYEKYQQTQVSYAEVILKRSELLYYPPLGQLQAAEPQSAAAPAIQLPADDKGVKVRHFTMEEAAGMRDLLVPMVVNDR